MVRVSGTTLNLTLEPPCLPGPGPSQAVRDTVHLAVLGQWQSLARPGADGCMPRRRVLAHPPAYTTTRGCHIALELLHGSGAQANEPGRFQDAGPPR